VQTKKSGWEEDNATRMELNSEKRASNTDNFVHSGKWELGERKKQEGRSLSDHKATKRVAR